MRRAKLAEHLSSAELQAHYLRCRHPVDRVRWHALWLISTGKSGNEAASLVGRTSGWASVLVRSYNERGGASVITVKREGRQWGGSEASLRWGTDEESNCVKPCCKRRLMVGYGRQPKLLLGFLSGVEERLAWWLAGGP